MKNLINLSGGDRLNLRVQDKILISESIKNSKTRQTQKEFANAGEAQKACVKKEWDSLKKGYVLQNSDAKAGEASLHIYIGGGYTGALAFAGAEGELFVYKCGGYKEGDALDDFLIRLDARGAVKQQIVLPKPLAWQAERAGEILNDTKGDFGIFDKICFLADGSLLGKERYTGKLVCLDTANGERLEPAWIRGECAEADELCISADGSRLALINYDKARIIDLKSGNLQLSFELSHVVKRCEAKFERINGEEFLAVHTDYGCFSLYRV